MTIVEVRASGRDYLELAATLLHRVRLADADAGVWEAADLQWWWRAPRRSDALEQTFWVDAQGPVAGVVLTDWGREWQCDPLLVPGPAAVPLSAVWQHELRAMAGLDQVEVLARDDDEELVSVLVEAGFVAGERSGNTWMDADDRPEVIGIPADLVLLDRTRPTPGPHPMQRRNGAQVQERLHQCPLYDPALDLAVESADGETAGYALFWCDEVTGVGLVEPMRVEDAYQRRGLASAMLREGLKRLADRGARRFKVGYDTEAARALYVGAGFTAGTPTTSYTRTTAPAT